MSTEPVARGRPHPLGACPQVEGGAGGVWPRDGAVARPTVKKREAPLVFTRADPAELARFDPSTKFCHMNCGPHRQGPGTRAERKLLCGDCYITAP